MLSIHWTRPGPRRDTEAVSTVPAAGPGAGRPPAGRGTGARRPGAVEAAQDAAQPATTTTPPAAPTSAAVAPPPLSSRKRTHRESRRRRSVLVRFDEAEYAAIAAAEAASRSVARVEVAAALVHRRLA